MRTTIAHGKSRYQQKDSTLWGFASTWEMRLTAPIPRPERTLTAEETKEVRSTAKDALSLQAEVARLEKLLSEAGVESSKRSRISSVSKERRRLRAALEQAENQKDKIKSLRTGCGELRKEVTRLNKEVARLNKRQARETQASETHKNTIGRQLDENIQLRAKLRIFRDQADRV